ncbi:FAD-linked oxidoreductase subF-like protein [Cladobotryum mycophilum]|uniref:FAD-linked oxidoreductase subF-like protein n=1 Tax=Cladobotryum mycophilum TaxID=491253 RepID=A0ABR0SWC8_9HYPO
MDQIIRNLEGRGIPVHRIGSEAYERSVATTNLLYRFSRPGCVVKPKEASHVKAVIEEARSHSITIKNGGHSYAGFSTADEGLLLDLSSMNGVELDMSDNAVTIEGGALWGHVYKALVNLRSNAEGYMINGGRCPTVGVSGFILGGGLGPFTRSLGMGCDALTAATLVTAGGDLVTVSRDDPRDSPKGKLFWALRGAGGANFGVLVKMKLGIKKLSSPNGTVVAGQFVWYPEPDARAMNEFMGTMNKFYAANWSKQMTIDSSWICELSETRSELGVRFTVYYDGLKEAFNREITQNIGEDDASRKHLAKQLKRRSMPEKSTRFLHETLVQQWSDETIKAFPRNRSYSIYSSFVFRNDPELIADITATIRREMKAFRKLFGGEQARLQVTWIHSGGVVADIDSSATAFRWRQGVYQAYITVEWSSKWLERDMRGFLGELRSKLQSFSMRDEGAPAAFINFPDRSLARDVYERAYYGHNHQELQQVKKIWDEGNFFKWVQGVQLPRDERPHQASDVYNSQSRGGSDGQEGLISLAPRVDLRSSNAAMLLSSDMESAGARGKVPM